MPDVESELFGIGGLEVLTPSGHGNKQPRTWDITSTTLVLLNPTLSLTNGVTVATPAKCRAGGQAEARLSEDGPPASPWLPPASMASAAELRNQR